MLRHLVLVLVLANVLFFGWVRGWFEPGWPAPRHAEREPERLAAQVRPELLTVVPMGAASAAVAAARAAALVCLEAGPFNATAAANGADIAAAEAALAPAALPAGSWVRDTVVAAPTWLVFAGRYADAGARRARREELKKLGLSFEALGEPEELAPGLLLSRHASREEADTALAALPANVATSMRVVELPGTLQQQWLRVPRADADTAERLKALPADSLAGGFKPCAARP